MTIIALRLLGDLGDEGFTFDDHPIFVLSFTMLHLPPHIGLGHNLNSRASSAAAVVANADSFLSPLIYLQSVQGFLFLLHDTFGVLRVNG